MNIISHDWTNSFGKFFAIYFKDGANNKTATLSCCKRYLPFYNIKTPIFEKVLNFNNLHIFAIYRTWILKAILIKRVRFYLPKKDLFAGLSNLNLQEFQKSVFKKLQDNIFGKLSDLDSLEFTIRQLQDLFKAETMHLNLLSQLLII